MRSAVRLIACLLIAAAIIIFPIYTVAQASDPLPPTITLDDLPDGFEADEELNDSGDVYDPETETGFGFTDYENGILLFGMTIQIEPDEFQYIAELIDDPDAYLDTFMDDVDVVPDVIRGSVVRHKTIGDNSVVVSVDHFYEDDMDYIADEFGDTERVDQVLYTVGDTVAMVLLGYPVTNPPSFSIEYIGSLWAERIAAVADDTPSVKAETPRTTATPTAPPTAKATATPTETAVSESDAVLPLLQLDDLPKDFMLASEEDLEGLIESFNFEELTEPLGSVAYGSELKQEVIFAILYDLQDPMMRLTSSVITSDPSALLDAMMASGEFDIESLDVAVVEAVEIGEASAAFSMLIPAGGETDFLLDMQFEMLWFEKDPYLGMLMLFYPSDESPEYTLEEIADVWESQIETALDGVSSVPVVSTVVVDDADATILAAALNVRSGPGTGFDRIGSLHSGDAVDVTARNGDCSWIEVESADATAGWVSASPNYVELHIDCDDVPAAQTSPDTGTQTSPDTGTQIRPNTGMLVNNFATVGWGELEVDNGSHLDQVVLLTDLGENVLAAAYVRNGDIFTLGDIPEGEYLVYFTGGTGWNEEKNTFNQVESYSMFEDTFDFVVEGDQVSTWSITLHGVAGGNADTPDVDAAGFSDF